MKPKLKFFAVQAEWRVWLKENHAWMDELWVGFQKKTPRRERGSLYW
jgi:hypothetical protein